jgi:hypothetical protein
MSYADSWKNRRVSSDRGIVFNRRLFELDRGLFGPRKRIIGKCRIRPNKYTIAEPHAVPQLNAALDRDGIAYDHVILDKYPIADITVTPDMRPWQNVRKGPNPCPIANVC